MSNKANNSFSWLPLFSSEEEKLANTSIYLCIEKLDS